MEDNAVNSKAEKILTVPNLLTLLRIFLIPLIVSESVFAGKDCRAAAMLLLSGLTGVWFASEAFRLWHRQSPTM